MKLETRAAALALREYGVPYSEICFQLNVQIQDLKRYFNHHDAVRYSERSMVSTSKLRAGEPGELDFDLYDRKEESKRAEALWTERMGFARWNVTRRDGEG